MIMYTLEVLYYTSSFTYVMGLFTGAFCVWIFTRKS